MDIHARVTSKGQVTIPKPVRDALNLEQGDAVLFQGAAPQPEAPRNRRPQVRVPDKIVITRTGGSFHHVSGCPSTTRGEEARTNRTLDKCGHCFPAFREE